MHQLQQLQQAQLLLQQARGRALAMAPAGSLAAMPPLRPPALYAPPPISLHHPLSVSASSFPPSPPSLASRLPSGFATPCCSGSGSALSLPQLPRPGHAAADEAKGGSPRASGIASIASVASRGSIASGGSAQALPRGCCAHAAPPAPPAPNWKGLQIRTRGLLLRLCAALSFGLVLGLVPALAYVLHLRRTPGAACDDPHALAAQGAAQGAAAAWGHAAGGHAVGPHHRAADLSASGEGGPLGGGLGAALGGGLGGYAALLLAALCGGLAVMTAQAAAAMLAARRAPASGRRGKVMPEATAGTCWLGWVGGGEAGGRIASLTDSLTDKGASRGLLMESTESLPAVPRMGLGLPASPMASTDSLPQHAP